MRKVVSPSITRPEPTSKMYAVCPIRRASSITCARRRPDLITTSAPGAVARLERSRREQRELTLSGAEERRPPAEQRPVEIRVDAPDAHYARAPRVAYGGRSDRR